MNKKETVVSLLPHNQELYDGIKTKLDAGSHSIFYSEATGLGKSYVFMKLLEERFANEPVLYIIPKISIWENLKMYKEFESLSKNVRMITMAAFNKPEIVDILAEDYKVVFVDEAHHLKSDKQGKNVAKLLQRVVEADGYTFGMTATPYVKGVFVDEEFYDEAVYGNDILDAICKGLIPKLRYEIGMLDPIQIPDDVKVKFNVESTQFLLEKIIADNKDINHWLAFFSTKAELEENEAQIRRLFPDFKIFKMHSGVVGNTKVLQKYNEYSGKSILMSVSMLLEGVHLKYCEGALLFRNVTVNNTMLQILGRLCKVNGGQSPLVVDITNSISNVKGLFAQERSKKNTYEHVIIDTSEFKELKKVIVCSQRTSLAFDLMAKLEELVVKEYRGVKWTCKEDLCRKLGKSLSAVRNYLNLNPGKTEYDYIDFLFKDYDYSEYVEAGYVGRFKYKGYEWTNYTELGLLLGVCGSNITDWMRNHNKTVKDYIDYKESETKEICGYCYKSFRELAEQLGITESKIRCWMQRHNGSLEDFVKDFLSKQGSFYTIKGIKFYTDAELCNKLGASKHGVHDWRRRDKSRTIESYVTFKLDAISLCVGIKFSDLYELAEHFNTTTDYINQWLDDNKASIQNFIEAHTGPKTPLVTKVESQLIEDKKGNV